MNSYTPDKTMVAIPGDAAFAAGQPVTAGVHRHLAQTLRHHHELITGGPIPGETTMTLDDHGEEARCHDHSGRFDAGGVAYHHGPFLGRIATCGPGMRLPNFAFAEWQFAAAGLTVQWTHGSVPEFGPAWKATFGTTYTNGAVNYLVQSPVHLRRGASHLAVRVYGFTVTSADNAPVAVHAGMFDQNFTLLHSLSASAPETNLATSWPLTPSADLLLRTRADAAPLDDDADRWLVIGINAVSDAVFVRDYYCLGLLAWERQIV